MPRRELDPVVLEAMAAASAEEAMHERYGMVMRRMQVKQRIAIEKVKLAELDLHPKFQRPLEEARVLEYQQNLTETLFGVPEVAVMADGTKAVIDGQHRVAAALLAGWEFAEVRVHYGKTYEEIVAAYRQMNNRRKRLEKVDDFHAAIEQRDPDALAIKSMVEAAGFKVGRGGSGTRIMAVGELYGMYRRNESLITEALVICREAWSEWLDDKNRLTAELIGGVHTVLHFHSDIDRRRLKNVLSKKSPRWWSEEADMATNSKRRSARAATLMVRRYNSGLRNPGSKLEAALYA